MPPEYHGSPINDGKCLVTYTWGSDIADFIDSCSNVETEIIDFPHTKENFEQGLEADFLQVLVSKKGKGIDLFGNRTGLMRFQNPRRFFHPNRILF